MFGYRGTKAFGYRGTKTFGYPETKTFGYRVKKMFGYRGNKLACFIYKKTVVLYITRSSLAISLDNRKNIWLSRETDFLR